MGHVKIYLCTKFDEKFMKGVKNLQIWPLTPPHPNWRNFVIREIGHVNIYLCTKFEVSSLTRSKFREDPINSAHGPPPRPLLEYFLIHKMGLANIYPCTKFEVSSFIRYKFMDFVMIHIQQTRLTVGVARSAVAMLASRK